MDSPCRLCQSNDAKAGARKFRASTGGVAEMGASRHGAVIRLRPAQFCIFHYLHVPVSETWSSVFGRTSRLFGALDDVLWCRMGRLCRAGPPGPKTETLLKTEAMHVFRNTLLAVAASVALVSCRHLEPLVTAETDRTGWVEVGRVPAVSVLKMQRV